MATNNKSKIFSKFSDRALQKTLNISKTGGKISSNIPKVKTTYDTSFPTVDVTSFIKNKKETEKEIKKRLQKEETIDFNYKDMFISELESQAQDIDNHLFIAAQYYDHWVNDGAIISMSDKLKQYVDTTIELLVKQEVEIDRQAYELLKKFQRKLHVENYEGDIDDWLNFDNLEYVKGSKRFFIRENDNIVENWTNNVRDILSKYL